MQLSINGSAAAGELRERQTPQHLFCGPLSLGLTVLLSVGVASHAAAATPAAAPRVVAATVDQQPIYVDQVERELKLVVGKRSLDPAARGPLLIAALDQLSIGN